MTPHNAFHVPNLLLVAEAPAERVFKSTRKAFFPLISLRHLLLFQTGVPTIHTAEPRGFSHGLHETSREIVFN